MPASTRVRQHPFYTPEILAAIREVVDQAPPLSDRTRDLIRTAFATAPSRPDVSHHPRTITRPARAA